MCYYTGRLTDKSDVFSFGVLLVELLTRKKPYVYRSVNNDGLVSHFVPLLREGNLVDIIDPQVIEEADGEIQEVATLAAMSTKFNGEDRPTMREVEMSLENLLVKKRLVTCNGTSTRNYGDQTMAHNIRTDRDTTEASRQYTMEEEMMLSATYPRSTIYIITKGESSTGSRGGWVFWSPTYHQRHHESPTEAPLG
jgi:serine/threonine protein kinase